VIRWLRVVIAPSWVFVFLLLGWTPYAVLGTAWGVFLGEPPSREVRDLGVTALCACAVCHGVYRAVRFHPTSRAGYAAWLAQTPWTPAKPLPDGPVLLAWQDAVVLALLLGPAWLVFGREAWPLVPAFALAYLFTLTSLVHKTGERAAAYLAWFGVGGLVLLAHLPAAVLAVAAATYAVAAVGFRRSLERFPWLPGDDEKARLRASVAHGLRWPFDRLAPLAPSSLLRPWEGPACGLLIAWSLFAVGFQLDRLPPNLRGEKASGLIEFSPALVLCLAAALRVGIYMYAHLPPISLLGRLATGRLIIPRYDVIFVAPLLAMVASPAGLVVFLEVGLPGYAGSAVGAGLAVGILLTAGPDCVRWQLTAPCRLVPLFKPPARQPAPVAVAISRL
jgi:hypothetical protein